MKKMRKTVLVCIALLLIVMVFQSSLVSVYPDSQHADNLPTYPVSDPVLVCGRDCNNRQLDFGPIGYVADNVNGTGYVPQVLANEWHWESQAQALRAGAVAIHTFAWRDIGGCGAIHTWYEVYPGGPEYRVLNSWSQRYWLDPDNQIGQNPISTAHRDAVEGIQDTGIFRSDWQVACAKYKANCGDPTANDSQESETLISVPDPVDSNNAIGTHKSGMSQNGTHAWELDDYDRAAPWDYRQMLSHYYAHVRLAETDYDYRWVWLNVTDDIKFAGTYDENYYGPLAKTPNEMTAGWTHSVPMRIQNTGDATWNNGGSNPVRLSYHWYDSRGEEVVWDGLRTALGQNVAPASDVSLNAQVQAPSLPGTYLLKWDMVKEGVTWFNWGDSWPTQDVTVSVLPAPGTVYLPAVRNSGGWTSSIVVRNRHESESVTVDVIYLDTAGSVVDSSSQTIPRRGMRMFTPPNSFAGTAIVSGGENVSVVVRTLGNSESLAYGGMPSQSALGSQASEHLYFPVYLQGFYNWNSYIDVTNMGSSPTTVRIRYHKNDGSPAGGGQTLTLDANASVHLVPSTSATIGGVRIVSENPPQPLAAVITQYLNNGPRRGAHAALNVGANLVYLPSVLRTFYGWESSINLFNTETEATGRCEIIFYGHDGDEVDRLDCNLAGYGSQTVALSGFPVPTDWEGSVVVDADKKLVAAVHQEQSAINGWQAYRGFSGGAPVIHLPWLQKGSGGWNGSLTVMNVGCNTTTATVHFYDDSGNEVGSPLAELDLDRYASGVAYSDPPIPSTARSAVVTTSPPCPIVAIVNEITSSISDGAVSYSGID